ncbi:MAG TPA: sulfatase-like hydrolase/transferase, partial [Polyangia bacterium]|nr:sulfatase-like hydrolase/transferase [Polyangia bacterium]
ALAFDSPWPKDGAAPGEIVERAGIKGAAFQNGAPRRDVLLITVDALRGDAIERTSPLARSALFFERAYSPSNYTPFSIPALVLGYIPAAGSDPPGSHTLAEAFHRGGYQTELHFTAHEYASLERTALWPLASRGFLFGRYRPDYLDATAVLGSVERTLAEGHGPRFVWAHLSDVHEPFLLRRRAALPGAACPATYAGQLECLLDSLAPWLERVRARHPDLVWALSSDHGESLGERGVRYHGSNLFDEQVRVPLLLGGPGIEPGVHPGPVGNARMGATLLGLAGARLPVRAVVLPRSPSEPPEPGVLLVCRRERCGLVQGGFKLIASPREGAVALYDLRADPGETANLVARDPAHARRMLAELPRLGCPFDLSGLMGVF